MSLDEVYAFLSKRFRTTLVVDPNIKEGRTLGRGLYTEISVLAPTNLIGVYRIFHNDKLISRLRVEKLEEAKR